jgi:hypothetical protein
MSVRSRAFLVGADSAAVQCRRTGRRSAPRGRIRRAPRRRAFAGRRPLLPGTRGCTLRAAKSSAGVTLEIAPGVPYARVAQFGSLEVTLPIGRDAPAAGVSVAAGTSS